MSGTWFNTAYMTPAQQCFTLSEVAAFDWYQNHRPWMTLKCCKFISELCASWHVWEAKTALKE